MVNVSVSMLGAIWLVLLVFWIFYGLYVLFSKREDKFFEIFSTILVLSAVGGIISFGFLVEDKRSKSIAADQAVTQMRLDTIEQQQRPWRLCFKEAFRIARADSYYNKELLRIMLIAFKRDNETWISENPIRFEDLTIIADEMKSVSKSYSDLLLNLLGPYATMKIDPEEHEEKGLITPGVIDRIFQEIDS